MMKIVSEAWGKYSQDLRAYWESFDIEELQNIGTYEDLLRPTINLILNTALCSKGFDGFNANRITVVDDGDYQGSLLFLIPLNTYQPDPYEYLITACYYGSCSGCDALQRAEWQDNKEDIVNDFMALCLNLLQNLRFVYPSSYYTTGLYEFFSESELTDESSKFPEYYF